MAGLYRGDSLAPVTLDQVVATVGPGTIVVVGEVHDSKVHHQNQADLINALGLSHSLNVGMEFFNYTDQEKIDAYMSGALTEDEFLKSILWSGFPFDFYREQVLAPLKFGGHTYGLNIPRGITRKVSQSGLGSLTAEELKLIPPGFEVGNPAYKERFFDVMKDHVTPEAFERYFVAQSLWDDTMAWKAIEAANRSPDSILVILVGEFHAAWGGGLPDRLRQRGWSKLLTIAQIQDQAELVVNPTYGSRADFIWIAH